MDNFHPGNVGCCTLIDGHRVERELVRHGGKRGVERKVVALIRQKGGRFLRMDRDLWFEVGDGQAIDSVSEAFEDGRFIAANSYLLSLRELAVYLVRTEKQSSLPECFSYLLQYLGHFVAVYEDDTWHLTPCALCYLKNHDDIAAFVEFLREESAADG